MLELSGGRGTGLLSHAAEQDACLLNENGSDQSMYSCPSPTVEGGDDLENMAASPPGLTRRHWKPIRVITWMWLPQLSSIRKQRSDQMFKSSRQKRSQTTPNPSTSVDTREVERKFAERNVTEKIVDDCRQADRGRKTRWNDVDGLTRCARSAGRIERLLRNKRSFGELWNQKGECEIPCDKQLCSFPTLSE